MLFQKRDLFYRSRLPHWQPYGAIFFVTFRLADAIPMKVVTQFKLDLQLELGTIKMLEGVDQQKLRNEAYQQSFNQYHNYLGLEEGSCLMKDPEIVNIVKAQIEKYDGKLYDLLAYRIMPNHVHILLKFFDSAHSTVSSNYQPLWQAMKKIKGASARYINLYRGQNGSIWQVDSYDRFIRSKKHLKNVLHYIASDPIHTADVKDLSFRDHICSKSVI